MRPLLLAGLLLSPALAAQGSYQRRTPLPAPVVVPTYTVRYVGPGTPVAVNDAGQAVGNEAGRAWLAEAGGGRWLLPLPAGATSSEARHLNGLGWVVGRASGAALGSRAVVWLPDGPDRWTPHLVPTSTDSDATAVNDLGDVVGWTVGGGSYAYRVGQALVPLFPHGFTAQPSDLNEERVVIGRGFQGTAETIDLDALTVVVHGLPTGTGVRYTSFTPYGLNDAGAFCGRAVVATALPDDDQAVRRDAHGAWRALNAPVPQAFAFDLDAAGNTLFAVGFSSPVYVHFEGAGSFDLNARLAPDSAGWFVHLTFGGDMSDAGLVVAAGANGTLGLSGVVVLVPR